MTIGARSASEGGEPAHDPDLELCVFEKRLKHKRFKLIEAFDLGGLPECRIIKLVQKELAADQRLVAAKEAEHQRPGNLDPGSTAQGDDRPANQLGTTGSPGANGLRQDRSLTRPNQVWMRRS